MNDFESKWKLRLESRIKMIENFLDDKDSPLPNKSISYC